MSATIRIKLDNSAAASGFRFDLDSGRYDIDVRYLSEKKQQDTWTLYIDGAQIVSWLGKNRDDQWHLLSEQSWHDPRNILIDRGAVIKIELSPGTGDVEVLDYISFVKTDRAKSGTRNGTVTVFPEEYENAFANPLKGFRSSRDTEHEYGTLIKYYIGWNELENSASDGVEKIIEVCDEKWRGIEWKNIKFIPRVYLAYPGQASGWPADMTEGDFTSDLFKQRVVALIDKLGKAWDGDSRVAFVEMGLIGEWGEMEWPDTRDDIKEAIAAQFAVSFRNKLVMIRWPHTYNDDMYNFGYYWDSWGHHDQMYYAFRLAETSPRWKTAVIGGEAAYDWGNGDIQPGKNPDETLSRSVHRDYMIDQIRKLHGNHMGWISSYDHSDEKVRAGAVPVQKALGYRFVVTEVTYPKRIGCDIPFTVSFKVTNTGSSPFYYNWPVEVSLLDPATRQPVWKDTCAGLDIRTWLPGDRWDDAQKSYSIPAESNLVNQTFRVSGLKPGEYLFALAILDPAGMRPCARFAIKNYFAGGRHPVGKTGVDTDIEGFGISGFDDLKGDRSLGYDA